MFRRVGARTLDALHLQFAFGQAPAQGPVERAEPRRVVANVVRKHAEQHIGPVRRKLLVRLKVHLSAGQPPAGALDECSKIVLSRPEHGRLDSDEP